MAAPARKLGEHAGEQTLRLDADRTRDELGAVLEEVRRRLTPKDLARSAAGSLRKHPLRLAGGIAAGAAVVTGIVVINQRAKRRG
jgi:hypothetical protein